MLFVLVVSAAFCWFLYLFIDHRYRTFLNLVRFSNTVKGPSIFEVIANSKREKALPFLYESSLKYGSRFSVWMAKDFVMFISSPEDAQTVLSSQELLFKSEKYGLIQPWLGDGLLLSGGEKWQKARKFLTPAFHFNILKEFKSAMEECCDVLIRKLETVEPGKPVNIYPFITLFALDVICETALGIKKNAQEDSNVEYVQAVKEMTSIGHRRSFNFFLRFDFIYRFSSYYQEEKKLLKILHDETYRVIDQRRSQILAWDTEKKEEMLKSLDSEYGKKRRLAFLDMLLIEQMEGKDMTNLQIREEVDTFMFEGHDTTSSAISFAIYNLSQHPEYQQKAYLEAVEFKGRETEQMKYLEAVIKETLRLFPSVPFYSRHVKSDFKLGDQVIPKGTIISVLAYAIHRNPQIFDNPNDFNPERYLTEKQFHPYSNVAFSAGPRNCIGQKFAMLELKSTLAKLIRHFKFGSADHNPILIPELILKSVNGIEVTITQRNI